MDSHDSSFIVLPRLADVLDGCINCYEGAGLWAAWHQDVTSSSQASLCKSSFQLIQTGSGSFGMSSIHRMSGAPQRLCEMKAIHVGYAQSGMSADYRARPRTTAKSSTASWWRHHQLSRCCLTASSIGNAVHSTLQRARGQAPRPPSATTLRYNLALPMMLDSETHKPRRHCLMIVCSHRLQFEGTHENCSLPYCRLCSQAPRPPHPVLVDNSHTIHARKHEAISFSRNYENHAGRYSPIQL
jgi:hypothetical protein